MKPTFLGRVVSAAALSRRPATFGAGLLLATTLLWSAPAAAQLSRVGNSVGVMDAWFFGSQACYDPAHQNYLVVGGQGPIYGVFTSNSRVELRQFY